MSGHAPDVSSLLILYLPQLIASILAIIAVWFRKGCHLPVGEVATIQSLLSIMLPIVVLCSDRCVEKLAGVIFITVLCTAVFVGFFYFLVAVILNIKHSSKCAPTWTKVFEWIYLSVNFASIILPIFALIIVIIREFIRSRRNAIREKKLKKQLLQLYQDSKLFLRAVVHNSEPELLRAVQSTPIDNKEIDIIREQLMRQTAADEEVLCSVCSGLCQEYLIIPECLHIVDEQCLRQFCGLNCMLCGQNIRKALLDHLHGHVAPDNIFIGYCEL